MDFEEEFEYNINNDFDFNLSMLCSISKIDNEIVELYQSNTPLLSTYKKPQLTSTISNIRVKIDKNYSDGNNIDYQLIELLLNNKKTIFGDDFFELISEYSKKFINKIDSDIILLLPKNNNLITSGKIDVNFSNIGVIETEYLTNQAILINRNKSNYDPHISFIYNPEARKYKLSLINMDDHYFIFSTRTRLEVRKSKFNKLKNVKRI